MQFSDFGLESRLMSTVEHLGFTAPTEIQQQAIPAAMQGKTGLCLSEIRVWLF